MNKYYTCGNCGGSVCDVTVHMVCPHCGEGGEKMKFLITVKIQDGDRKYFDYFTITALSVEDARQKVESMMDNTNAETIETIENVVEISDHDRNILINYGVI